MHASRGIAEFALHSLPQDLQTLQPILLVLPDPSEVYAPHCWWLPQMSQEQIEEMMQQSRANAEGKGTEVEMEMQTSESSPAPQCGSLLACPALHPSPCCISVCAAANLFMMLVLKWAAAADAGLP